MINGLLAALVAFTLFSTLVLAYEPLQAQLAEAIRSAITTILQIMVLGGLLAIVVGVVIRAIGFPREGQQAIVSGATLVAGYFVLTAIIGMLGFRWAGVPSVQAAISSYFGFQLLGIILSMIVIGLLLLPAIGVGFMIATITGKPFSMMWLVVSFVFLIIDSVLLGFDLGLVIWVMAMPAYTLGGLLGALYKQGELGDFLRIG
jgi:hypothetical protein